MKYRFVGFLVIIVVFVFFLWISELLTAPSAYYLMVGEYGQEVVDSYLSELDSDAFSYSLAKYRYEYNSESEMTADKLTSSLLFRFRFKKEELDIGNHSLAGVRPNLPELSVSIERPFDLYLKNREQTLEHLVKKAAMDSVRNGVSALSWTGGLDDDSDNDYRLKRIPTNSDTAFYDLYMSQADHIRENILVGLEINKNLLDRYGYRVGVSVKDSSIIDLKRDRYGVGRYSIAAFIPIDEVQKVFYFLEKGEIP